MRICGMHMSLYDRFIAGLCLVPLLPAAIVNAGTADVVAATYGAYSLTPPTPAGVVICHGFGCKYRVEVGLTAADRGTLARLLAPGKASAAAERRAVAAAGAWFDRRIGPAAGTRAVSWSRGVSFGGAGGSAAGAGMAETAAAGTVEAACTEGAASWERPKMPAAETL